MTEHKGLDPSDPNVRARAEFAAELQPDQLKRVRSVADKWRTGMSAFTGVVATVAAVGAPLVAKEITNSNIRYLIAALLLVAVFSLARGTWNLMDASFGTMDDEVQNSDGQIKQWIDDEISSIKEHFKSAQVWALVGVSALVLASGLSFLPPGMTNDGSVSTSDHTYCGGISSSKDGKTLTVVGGSDGESHDVKLQDLTGLALEAC
jgi:hypothetical protein